MDVDRSGFLDKGEVTELGDILQRGWSGKHTERLMRMMCPRGDRVYPEDFRNFVKESLNHCFDRLARGASRLMSEDLRPVSREMNIDHHTMMSKFSGGVDRETFVWFIMSQAMHGPVELGHVVAMALTAAVLSGACNAAWLRKLAFESL